MGWIRSGPPARILKGQEIVTSSKAIADTLNSAYIEKTQRIHHSIPNTNTDPLTNYREAIAHTKPRLYFKPINMSQLRKVMTKMKPTASVGVDEISYRTIKDSRSILEPHILHLVNQTITSKSYPKNLKHHKIAPILKSLKDEMLPDSWRPVNLLPAIGKIIDRVILQQILEYYNYTNSYHHNAMEALEENPLQQVHLRSTINLLNPLKLARKLHSPH